MPHPLMKPVEGAPYGTPEHPRMRRKIEVKDIKAAIEKSDYRLVDARKILGISSNSLSMWLQKPELKEWWQKQKAAASKRRALAKAARYRFRKKQREQEDANAAVLIEAFGQTANLPEGWSV